MKILVLNWRDIKHPFAGGAEISLFEHAKYWNKKGAEVIWFSAAFPHCLSEEVLDGIKIYRKGSAYTVHLWAFFYYIRKKISDCDIVVDSFHFIPYFSTVYMRKKKKIVGLINEVAGELWFSNLFYPLAYIGYYIESYFFRFYKENIFITGSQSAKNDLIRCSIKESHIYIVAHGVHLQKVSSNIKKEIEPTLVFLGRISKDKGIADALEAFRKVFSHNPKVNFWIIGKEEKPGELNEIYALYKNDDTFIKNITWYGYVTEQKKFELLKRAWLLIHPSIREGWGLNVIEAASQGVPTIAYDVPGLRDSIINGKTGILVNKNVTNLSRAIELLFTDKKKYNELSQNAKEWSDNFSWEDTVKKSWSILSDVYTS